jgi:6-pyruvoyltetrahydropterin/6-carboxytetrahydropterin synthase
MPRPSSRRRSARAVSPEPAGPVVVTRTVHFNAAHRLHNPAKSAAWNRTTFGLCNHPNWHGHNYTLEVSVRGTPDPDTGCVIDLGELKAIIERVIVAKCDHRNLNLDVDFLRGIIPSSENLVLAFWRELERALPSGRGRLYRVRLDETERNRAEYFGPAGPPAPG